MYSKQFTLLEYIKRVQKHTNVSVDTQQKECFAMREGMKIRIKGESPILPESVQLTALHNKLYFFGTSL